MKRSLSSPSCAVWAMCAALPACSGSDASWAALGAVVAVALATLVARWRARRAEAAERRRVLADLLRFGPSDGGDLLAIWPRHMSIRQLDALMLDLERRALVARQPSAIDPVWRDLWRLTDAGRRAAGIVAALALCLAAGCASPSDAHGPDIVYLRDVRTSLCFATLQEYGTAPAISWVPCSGPVLDLIELEVTAAAPRPERPVPALALRGAP